MTAGPGPLLIRDATPADHPAVIAIYNQSIPGGRSTADTAPITVESRAAWFAAFDPARRPLWVAELDGEVVAWIGLTSFYAGRPAYDATAEVSLYVATAHQGRGIGGGLKRRMIAACPGFGLTTLLSFYFDHNAATAKLNERLGFVVAGHLPDIATVAGAPRGLMIGLLRVPAG